MGFWRKRIDRNHMPDNSLATLRRLSDDDLIAWTAGWQIGSARRNLGEYEIRRREGRTARLALLIAFASLVVSICVAVFKT